MSLQKFFTILKGGSGSGNFGHSGRKGKLGGSTPKRVFTGQPTQWEGERLTKLQVGQIGEDLAMKVLSQEKGVPFETVNIGLNNAPIDVAGDHLAVEVKTGLSTNSRTAQHWRATIGEPGKQEKALIAQMSKEEKKAHNQYKQQKILERKQAMLDKMSEIKGEPVKGMTIGIILHPDGSKGDVYRFDGFHSRIPWKKADQMGEFMGTYNV